MRRTLLCLALTLGLGTGFASALQPQTPMRSPVSEKPITCTFVNETKQTVKIYWIDYEGREVFYGSMEPMQKHVQPTAVGHIWRFKAGGKVLGIAVAPDGGEVTIPISVAEAPKPDRPRIGLPTPGGLGDEEKKLVEMINAERAKANVRPLKINLQLTVAARRQVAAMAKVGKMQQVIDGKGVTERVADAGYKAKFVDQNVARFGPKGKSYGRGIPATPADAVPHMLKHALQRKRLLDSHFTETGVAILVSEDGTTWWSQVFGVPTSVPAPVVPNPAVEVKLTAEEKQVLELVNAARAKAELPALKPNAQLMKAAREHVDAMARANLLSQKVDEKGVVQRVGATGYAARLTDQNIAKIPAKGMSFGRAIPATPADVVPLMLGHPLQKSRMLHRDYSETGIAIVVTSDGTTWWTQVFACR